MLSWLGYCNVDVPAAAVHIMIFQLPPSFLKIDFKKSLDGIQYSIVEKQQTWTSLLKLPHPYWSIRNPGFLCLTPKRVIKFRKCLESKQDSAMQSGSPITNLLCSPTVVAGPYAS